MNTTSPKASEDIHEKHPKTRLHTQKQAKWECRISRESYICTENENITKISDSHEVEINNWLSTRYTNTNRQQEENSAWQNKAHENTSGTQKL